MKSQNWWVVAVTAWSGPDEAHRLIIKLTRSQVSGTESRAVASVEEACSQLADWLQELDTAIDNATPER